MQDGEAVPDKGSDLTRMLQTVAVPANTEVVNAALSLVVALAKATVPGADGVSVMLSRRGTLTTVAASDGTISGMDSDQYAAGEGPCLSAASLGHRVHVDSLDAESRWPGFVPRALKRGINSILSMPLLTRGEPLGALNIYSTTAGAFAGADDSAATLCARHASDLLLASSAVDIAPEDFSARIGDALKVRQTITLAVGVLMARQGVSVDDGYGMLLRESQENGRTMRQEAEVVVASTQSA